VIRVCPLSLYHLRLEIGLRQDRHDLSLGESASLHPFMLALRADSPLAPGTDREVHASWHSANWDIPVFLPPTSLGLTAQAAELPVPAPDCAASDTAADAPQWIPVKMPHPDACPISDTRRASPARCFSGAPPIA